MLHTMCCLCLVDRNAKNQLPLRGHAERSSDIACHGAGRHPADAVCDFHPRVSTLSVSFVSGLLGRTHGAVAAGVSVEVRLQCKDGVGVPLDGELHVEVPDSVGSA